MINTVQVDELAGWHPEMEPVQEISIRDFEQEDDDELFPEVSN